MSDHDIDMRTSIGTVCDTGLWRGRFGGLVFGIGFGRGSLLAAAAFLSFAFLFLADAVVFGFLGGGDELAGLPRLFGVLTDPRRLGGTRDVVAPILDLLDEGRLDNSVLDIE